MPDRSSFDLSWGDTESLGLVGWRIVNRHKIVYLLMNMAMRKETFFE
jgi:hypothetical protein